MWSKRLLYTGIFFLGWFVGQMYLYYGMKHYDLRVTTKSGCVVGPRYAMTPDMPKCSP